MKRAIVYMTMLSMITMTGCLVSSLHPFFKQKDKYFDPAMVGNWIDGDSCIWTITPNSVSESFLGPEKFDSTFRITYFEEGDEPGKFTGTLFKIKGSSYVDFYPDPDEDHCNNDLICWHHFPTHTLARVQFSKDSILLYWYGEEWLNNLFEQNRIRIRHETVQVGQSYSRQILTASTDELQKFIKKYANDPQTLQEIETIFERGYTDDQEEYGVFLKLKPYCGPVPGEKAMKVRPG